MNHKEIMEKISELEQQIAELKEAAQKQDEPNAWKPKVEEDNAFVRDIEAIDTALMAIKQLIHMKTAT